MRGPSAPRAHKPPHPSPLPRCGGEGARFVTKPAIRKSGTETSRLRGFPFFCPGCSCKSLREKFRSVVISGSDRRNRQAFTRWSDQCDAAVGSGLLIFGNMMACHRRSVRILRVCLDGSLRSRWYRSRSPKRGEGWGEGDWGAVGAFGPLTLTLTLSPAAGEREPIAHTVRIIDNRRLRQEIPNPKARACHVRLSTITK